MGRTNSRGALACGLTAVAASIGAASTLGLGAVHAESMPAAADPTPADWRAAPADSDPGGGPVRTATDLPGDVSRAAPDGGVLAIPADPANAADTAQGGAKDLVPTDRDRVDDRILASFLAEPVDPTHLTARWNAGGGAGDICNPGDITYNVNEAIGGGSLVGQIVTDGVLGVLSASDIVGWNLQLNGLGATFTLTSAGGSAVQLVGSDLTATSTQLLFNFNGTDHGYFAFQVSPGQFSGTKYWCVAANYTGCAQNAAAVVPGSSTDASAQYQAMSGTQVIGTAGFDDSLLVSVLELAEARLAQMLVYNLESALLLGLDEQISCGSCGGADMGFGSFAISAHGRHALTPEWTVMGGVDVGQYRQRGADVTLNAGFAASLQYDPAGFGPSRPYATFGLSGALQNTRYSRAYGDPNAPSIGTGKTRSYDVGAFGQVGWVNRVTPTDEAAVYASYARTWQIVGGYAEVISNDNPFNAVVPGGTDVLDVASLNAQYTHLFSRWIEADINGGMDWAFNSQSGLKPTIGGLQIATSQPEFLYYQLGGRLGVRVTHTLTVDLFLNGILAPKAIGASLHGGFGARWTF